MARKRFHLWLGCLVLLIATLGVAAGASAGYKYYTVNLPETVGVGQDVPITATIKNNSGAQSLGSVNLTAPAGYDLTTVTASRGAVALAGETAQLRNLSLPPGATVTVSMKAEVSCAPTGDTWTSAAKQANDFNGTGNDFDLDPASKMTTRTDGTCQIQATCVEDNTSSCTKRLTYRGVLEVTEDGAATSLVRSLAGTAAAVRQIFYELTLETEAFATQQVPDAGTLTMAWQPGQPQDCAGYNEIAPIRGLVDGPVNRTKGIAFTIDQSLMEYYGRDAEDLEMCMAAPQPFLWDATNPAYVPGTTSVNGAQWFTGILPDCIGPEQPAEEPNTADLPQPFPCVYDRSTDGEGNGVISVEVPFTYPDPTFRG